MILGIDPKVDYAFKKLFGSEANKPLLIRGIERRFGTLVLFSSIWGSLGDGSNPRRLEYAAASEGRRGDEDHDAE